MIEKIIQQAFENAIKDFSIGDDTKEQINDIDKLQEEATKILQGKALGKDLSEDETQEICDSIENLLNKIEEKQKDVYGKD